MAQNIFKKIVILFLSCIIFLIILEISLRIYSKDCPDNEIKNFHKKDNLLAWKPMENIRTCEITNNKIISYKTNERGYRMEKEVPITKNKTRIILVGDSFIWGHGLNLEETYSTHLEKNLGANYEIINLGVSGYGTDQELIYSKREKEFLKPDLFIVNIFINDYGNNIAGIYDKTKKNYFAFSEGHNFKWLKDKKQLHINYSAIKEANITLVVKHPKNETEKNIIAEENEKDMEIKKLIKTARENIKKTNYTSASEIRSELYLFEDEYFLSPHNASIIMTFKLLEMFEKINKESDVIYVSIPFRAQHDLEYRKKLLKKFSDMEKMPNFDLRTINILQKGFMAYHNYNYIDLLDYLNETDIYQKNDFHWNEKGAKTAANVVSEYIKSTYKQKTN